MRHEGVDHGRRRDLLAPSGGESLLQGSLDESVFLVGEGRFDILAQRFGDAPGLAVADFGPLGVAPAFAEALFGLGVAFEHLHRIVAGRESLGQFVAVVAHVAVEPAQPLFDHGTHVDMDMAHTLVAVLIDIDHGVQQGVDAAVVARLDGHHRHAQHAAQILVVEGGSAGLQLVVHVERHDHTRV